jgi:hypothetical protein
MSGKADRQAAGLIGSSAIRALGNFCGSQVCGDARRSRIRPAAIGLLTLLLCAAFTTPATRDAAPTQSMQTEDDSAIASSCRSRVDCGRPIKAGVRLTFTGWACTSGFVGRDETSGRAYVVTAGHCLVNAGISALWSHGDVEIGHGVRAVFGGETHSDGGMIELSDGGPTNLLFASGPFDVRRITGTRPNQSQTIGARVCRSGAASGWACGSITRTDTDVRIGAVLVRHAWWTDFPSARGDSGGPVIDDAGRILGIVIATNRAESVYVTVDTVAAVLGVRPCLDPTCR